MVEVTFVCFAQTVFGRGLKLFPTVDNSSDIFFTTKRTVPGRGLFIVCSFISIAQQLELMILVFSEKIVNVVEEERLFKEKELEQLEKKIAEVKDRIQSQDLSSLYTSISG